MYTVHLENESKNIELAHRLESYLRPPLLIGLQGSLGMGKSSMVRAILQAMGVTEKVKSPTYSLCELYETRHGQAAHLDCYRLSDFEELELIGFRDLFDSPHMIFIEWPEILQEQGITFDLIWKFDKYEQGRQIVMQANTEIGSKLINMLIEQDRAVE